MTKEDSCKPSWTFYDLWRKRSHVILAWRKRTHVSLAGGGGRVSMRRSIRMVIYPGRINRRHPGSSSPHGKNGLDVQPSPSDLLVNAANECCNSRMATANDDGVSWLESNSNVLQWLWQLRQSLSSHATEEKKYQQLRWYSKCSTHTFTRRSGHYCFRVA